MLVVGVTLAVWDLLNARRSATYVSSFWGDVEFGGPIGDAIYYQSVEVGIYFLAVRGFRYLFFCDTRPNPHWRVKPTL